MFKIIRHSFVFGIYFILLTYYAESSEPDNKVACEPPWEKLHRSCVWFVKDKSFSTWQAARDFCTKHNGELLCINDMAEKNNTETLMRNHVKSQDLMSWWVGLKLSTNGTWFWVDKEQLNRHLIGWDIGAGNTAGPDGLVLQNRCSTLFFRGYLKDEDCDIAKPFICERMKGDSQKEEMPEKQKTTASQSQNREISVKQATPRVNSQNRETLAKPTTTKADSQNKEDIRNWKIITTNSQNRETLAKQETATPNSQNRNIFEKQETMLAKQKTTTNKIQKRETLAQQKSTTSNSLTRELLAKQETTTKNSHNREISVMLKKTLAKHETTEDKAADYSLRSEMLAEQRTTTVRKPIEDGFVDKIEQLFHPLYQAESSESDNEVICEPPWEKMHRSCVWFVNDKPFSTWQTARDFCTKHNGDLLCINSMLEEDNIEPLMRNHVKSKDLMYWWIGLKLLANGTWFWVDKEELNRRLIGWDFGAGKTKGPDGLVLQNRCSTLFFQGYIKDEDCDTARPFICERMKVLLRATTSSTSSQKEMTTPLLKRTTVMSIPSRESVEQSRHDILVEYQLQYFKGQVEKQPLEKEILEVLLRLLKAAEKRLH